MSVTSAVIRRDMFDRALFETAARSVYVLLPAVSRAPVRVPDGYVVDRVLATRLIDATGRRAITATSRSRYHAVAWQWSAPTRTPETLFGIAALTTGYAYRVRGGGLDALGIVSWTKERVRQPAEVLDQHDVGWVGRGFDFKGADGPAQWSCGLQTATHRQAFPSALGDARFARDSLASQGTLHAVLDGCRGPNAGLVREHCDELIRVLLSSRFATGASWRSYRRWVQAKREVGQVGIPTQAGVAHL